MTAEVIKLPRASPSKLRCSSCGATTDAACDCGVSYEPAIERARKIAEENPEMSVRQVAKAAGVGVATAHRAMSPSVPDGTPSQGVEDTKKNNKMPSNGDSYFERLARPPEQTIKLIMGLIRNLDPDQRETLFAKLRKRYRL